MRRLVNFDRVSKLFSLLDDELNDNFYVEFDKRKYKENIIDMVDQYLLNTYTADEISFPNEDTITQIKLYFEQFPLLFEM